MHHRAAPVIDPSEELIGVTNVFLRWHKLFRQTIPAAEINILRSLSNRQMTIIVIVHIIDINCIMFFILIIDIIAFEFRLLDLFKTVFHTATN